MAETIHIAAMAERLAKDIFGIYHWQRVGPTNNNWACTDPHHERLTHPSDVVFYYDNPYDNDRTYINLDLKSYAKNTITKNKVHNAAKDLAKAVACAEHNVNWQTLFAQETSTAQLCGVLFIYNHDGNYDEDFTKTIRNTLDCKDLELPRGTPLIILGPEDIFWLHNVADDIIRMRGIKELPDANDCRYHYSNLILSKKKQPQKAIAATIEMLTGPWIILEYNNPQPPHARSYLIYYRRPGDSIEEFQYLIDYLLHYQLLSLGTPITLKLLPNNPKATATFANAKVQYVDDQEGSEGLKELLDTITCTTMTKISLEFSTVALGMQDA